PFLLMASTCAANWSTSRTSEPASASEPPMVEPSAPAPTMQILIGHSSATQAPHLRPAGIMARDVASAYTMDAIGCIVWRNRGHCQDEVSCDRSRAARGEAAQVV